MNRALNFFFVADIEGGDAGFSLLGESGGVPGPPTLHGTERSGVMVNMANFEAAKDAGDDGMLTEATKLTEIIMAHEGGHYLGLFAIPLEAAGLFLVYRALLPAGKRLALGAALAGLYLIYPGVAYHGTVYPLSDAVRRSPHSGWSGSSRP